MKNRFYCAIIKHGEYAINTGIYEIRNTVTNDLYIGQSVNIKKRRIVHFCLLNNKHHPNRHLQRAFNKYSENSFKLNILLVCEDFELTRYEQGLVDRLKPTYNIKRVCVDSATGILRSKETKLKMSLWQKGKHLSEEHKKKLSLAHIGKTLSDEHKRHVSESLKGRIGWNKGLPMNEETKRKISATLTGKPRSEDTKKKISESHKRRNHNIKENYSDHTQYF